MQDDFRHLYTTTEKMINDYKSVQETYKKNKVEMNRLNSRVTELQSELSAKDERCANLELQLSELNQRCAVSGFLVFKIPINFTFKQFIIIFLQMLLQMNSGLDNHRRSLMDHISELFSQYHELLTHSLEDKEHYFKEEKMYT